ncbi:terpene synthase 10-like [Senna tora]|uniref:Terpene synthase 10-like n=1 Tax=Senna tora TaxID=362788 RepID=A0A835CF48_9FABA|nr:terpene synthase 10-like [Senna tora]
MALLHLASLSLPSKMLPLQYYGTTKTSSSSNSSLSKIQCTKSNINVSTTSSPIVRRSADFKPTLWTYDYVQSLGSKYKEESYAKQNIELKEEVRMMLDKKKEEEPLLQLEFIDVLQRLGGDEKDVHATSLEFRLLRQHGFNLSTEVFDGFLDEMGNFKKLLSADIQGVLSLYEASFLTMENESILDKAREFSREILEEHYVTREKKENDFMSLLINHALEVPLHWRMQRWEARWFIKAYETAPNVIPSLLQFAKLDFNMLQATYLEELKDVLRGWKRIGSLTEKLGFSRDRSLEDFVWSTGFNYLPQDGRLRIGVTKAASLVTQIDDVYDVYGTLDELELFTQFWAELCKSYLVEARWYYNGYKPSLQEYLENAWISASSNVMVVHAYYFLRHPVRKQDLDYFEQDPPIFRYLGLIFRIANDLGTSKMERGDVPKALQCYMNEFEASEEEGREYLGSMIRQISGSTNMVMAMVISKLKLA